MATKNIRYYSPDTPTALRISVGLTAQAIHDTLRNLFYGTIAAILSAIFRLRSALRFVCNIYPPSRLIDLNELHCHCRKMDNSPHRIFLLYIKGYPVKYICTQTGCKHRIIITSVCNSLKSIKTLNIS